jgi:hypothetical protein
VAFGAILVVLLLMIFGSFVGYVAYKEGWLNLGTGSKTSMWSYYDNDLKQTLYFATQAERDSYVSRKGITTGGAFPIRGSVNVYGNGTLVTGVTVELYQPPATADGLYVLKESLITVAGVFSGVVPFNVGSAVMLHVERSGTTYTYDRWVNTVVPPKGQDMLFSLVGAIEVYPYARATPTFMMQLGNGTAISSTQGTIAVPTSTPLSKTGGATDINGRVQLMLAEAWGSFGMDPFTQPAPSRGHLKREYLTVMTIASNVSISWKDSSYTKISVSSGTKYAKIVQGTAYSPLVLRTMSTGNKAVQIEFWMDLSALATGTGVAITVHICDYQLWSTIVDDSYTTTVTTGTSFGRTYDVTGIRYIIVRA